MIIEVTQEDIDQGQQHEGQFCAIARAIKRVSPEFEHYSVTGDGVYTDEDQYTLAFRATKKMRQFINDFDRNKSNVKPTKFRILRSK